ncbi:MAG: electron transfer flavoprotein subunit alpha/FixB family protein [Nitrospirae bacterium]|nr:MAG: electron transfer flavoprotein subunit alpha/FixB family protein [Nitrospirota bacterium]
MEVLILVEHADGRPTRAGLEAIAAGQAVAEAVGGAAAALLLGEAAEAAQEVAAYDLAEVLTAGGAALAEDPGSLQAEAVRAVVEQERPAWLVASHTYPVRDLLPKVSARLGRPFVADCTGFRSEAEGLVLEKPVYNGRLVAEIIPEGEGVVLVSFQAAAFAADAARAGTAPVREAAVELDPAAARGRAEAPFRADTGGIDITTAERLVSIGRGLGKPENLPVVEELARALGAELACSRPVVDAGWLPPARQVGSSGQTVAPKLYLALGISGAAQHLVGMKGSQHIVAVNKDPEAPIFDVADVGIVADLFEIAPRLTERLRQGS